MNKDIFEGKWDQAKGSLKEAWSKLSDDDLSKVHGQKDKLIGLIQEAYGATREDIEDKITAIFEKLK